MRRVIAISGLTRQPAVDALHRLPLLVGLHRQSPATTRVFPVREK